MYRPRMRKELDEAQKRMYVVAVEFLECELETELESEPESESE